MLHVSVAHACCIVGWAGMLHMHVAREVCMQHVVSTTARCVMSVVVVVVVVVISSPSTPLRIGV